MQWNIKKIKVLIIIIEKLYLSKSYSCGHWLPIHLVPTGVGPESMNRNILKQIRTRICNSFIRNNHELLILFEGFPIPLVILYTVTYFEFRKEQTGIS